MSASVVATPDTLRFGSDGRVPNHPWFPVLWYHRVLDVAAADGDCAAAFEALFAAHGWPPRWRAGVYPWHHYHARAHEAFGIASGCARLRLGGAQGTDIELVAGDALVLPAGTAHCGLEASADFIAVGAYPVDADVDMQRESEGVPATLLAMIRAVPRPATDPVAGGDGPLTRLWTLP